MLTGMASRSRHVKTLALLLAAAALTACVGPRKEAVPYMSSEGVANAAYTANYNGNASASGKARTQPAAQTEETGKAEEPISEPAEANEK